MEGRGNCGQDVMYERMKNENKRKKKELEKMNLCSLGRKLLSSALSSVFRNGAER